MLPLPKRRCKPAWSVARVSGPGPAASYAAHDTQGGCNAQESGRGGMTKKGDGGGKQGMVWAAKPMFEKSAKLEGGGGSNARKV